MLVTELQDSAGDENDRYLLGRAETLMYASWSYRALLRAYTGADPHYFVARSGEGEFLGVLPSFMFRGRLGPVLNSLPFYGSNGGAIVHSGDPATKHALVDAFHRCAEQSGCISATIITSPFESDLDLYESDSRFTLRDERIGQITPLPPPGPDIESRLLAQFSDPRPRNIRRALKAGVVCGQDNSEEALRFLSETHFANIVSIGGLPKDQLFFQTLARELGREQFRIYVARINETRVAALLVLYFNRTVEYFTPATVELWRGEQPLALLIFRAMCDAVERGYRWWNWGGTWLTQGGVYDFKRRWGTVERRYKYYTRVLTDSILSAPKSELLQSYPNFYVVPFNELRAPPRTTALEDA